VSGCAGSPWSFQRPPLLLSLLLLLLLLLLLPPVVVVMMMMERPARVLPGENGPAATQRARLVLFVSFCFVCG
jgi:hypothetical protein